MAIYRYRCRDCAHEFSRLERMDSEGATECPREGCQGKPEKTVARCSFALKGKGWYADGY